MLLAIFQPGDVNAFTSALDPASLRLQAQCQLFSKHALRIVTDFLVPQAAKSTADPEQPNPHAQPGQRLAQFQADDTGAEYRYRFRQILPVKHIVVND